MTIQPSDLLQVEPMQPFANAFNVAVNTPLKQALTDPSLFLAAHRRLAAGDRVTLFRFVDDTRQRLLESATVVIAQSHPNAVEFKIEGAICSMPAPSKQTLAGVEEDLTVTRIPHDYRLVEDFEAQNDVTMWRVQDGAGRTIEAPFKARDAAEEFRRYQLASFPDWIVVDSTGATISPRYRTKQEADAFIASERKRRSRLPKSA